MLAPPWTLGRTVVALLCVAVASPAFAQEGRRKPPALEGVNKAVTKHIEDKDVAGAVTLVIEDGKIVHLSGLGNTNLKTEKPMRPGAMFAIASMTKPITATALMTLVEEGKVGLDDPVSKYIPEFADVTLDGMTLDKPITIRQCLTHTAGLGGSQRVVGSLESTAKELAERPLRYEPGTKWEYSPGLNVVGRVIEVASGKPYGEFLQERIFDPLKMNTTTFHPNEKQQARIATLYAKNKDSGELTEAESWIGNFDTDPYPNPSAGLYSTARDLAKFYGMMLNGGFLGDAKILSRDSVKELTKLQTGDIETGFTPGNGWGLGYCVVQEPQGVSAALSPGSFGHGGAFGTQSWGDPEKKRAYILLVQRSNFPNSDASDLRKDFQDAAAAELNK